MLTNRLQRVIRAARLEAAGWRQEWAQEQLIATHHTTGDRRAYGHVRALPPTTTSADDISLRKSASGAWSAHARATKTTFRSSDRA